MSKQKIAILATGFLFVLFVLWLQSLEQPQEIMEDVEAKSNELTEMEVVESEAVQLTRLKAKSQLRFLDTLTNKPLSPANVSWINISTLSDPIPVSQGIDQNILERLVGEWEYRNSSKENIAFRISLHESLSEGTTFKLPVFSKQVIRVIDGSTGHMVEGASCEVYELEIDKYNAILGSGKAQAPESFIPVDSIQFRVEEYQRSYGRNEWIALNEENSEGEFQKISEGAMFFAARVEHPSYGATWIICESIAGVEQTTEVVLRKRPTLSGILRNEKLEILPNMEFDILVLLDKADTNLGSTSDSGFSLLVAGLPGSYTRVARKKIRTDKEGMYSLIMPRGNQYALELRTRELYGFAESKLFSVPPTLDVKLDLVLKTQEGGYEVVVVDALGSPLEGVFVQPIIADDFPWFRQIPGRKTGLDGRAYIPELVEGAEKIRIYVRMEWDSLNYVFRSSLLTLPTPPLNIQVE